jgi:hypothetical protein
MTATNSIRLYPFIADVPIDNEQQTLSCQMFEALHERFPEIEWLGTAQYSPENAKHLWVDILVPSEDEDRKAAIRQYMIELSTDILEQHGSWITLKLKHSAFQTA